MMGRRGWIGVVALGIVADAGCASRPLDPWDPSDPMDPVDQPHPVMDAGTERPPPHDATDAMEVRIDRPPEVPPRDAADALEAGIDRPTTPPDAWVASDALSDPCPVTQPPPGTFTFLSAGNGGTCGLRADGTMACWGVSWQFPEPNPPGAYRDVSRHDRVCAIRSSGEIECWGSSATVGTPAGTYEQVVVGESALCARSPGGRVTCSGGAGYAPGDYSFRALTGGAYYVCGLEAAQTSAVCWEPRVGAESVLVRPGPFSAVDTGRFFACGLRTDGNVECWATTHVTPIAVILTGNAPPGPFVQLTTGEFHACALRADGEVVCWGEDRDGQATPPAGLRLIRVEGGSSHSCGIQMDGTVVCWGNGGWACTPAGRG